MIAKYIALCFAILSLNSCLHPSFKFEKSKEGEPILNPELYTFKEILTDENFKIIDTNSYYIETFQGLDSNEGQRANPMIYKFHSDGYFKQDSYLHFGNFDKERNKKSAYYGGKYKLEGNIILMESFYPASAKSNRFVKVISKGTVKNDTIIIDFFKTTHKYVKKNYNQIF
ncbi:MAG: hypothetical protein ACKO8L_00105 [Flavobacterium sp.]